MNHIDLPIIWAGIIAFAVFAYVLMDGFDLGIGILFPAFAVGEERDQAMNSIAPVWDGNETWLVLGGGGLLAAFSLAYAILMPALYTPMIAMLVGLIFRGVAFEFRWRTTRSERNPWDLAFTGGSLLAALAQGIALGAVSIATPFLNIQYTQRWFSWPNIVLTAPVPIAVAGVTVLLLRALANKWDYQPFFLSRALFALSYAGLGISMHPYIVPQSITIWQAAASESSLRFLLIGVAVLIPLILSYTAWAYWVFRSKVRPESGYH